jgi:hypothetical protein
MGTASETLPATLTWLWVVRVPLPGEVIVSAGGVVARVVVTDEVVDPKLLVAVAVRVLAP